MSTESNNRGRNRSINAGKAAMEDGMSGNAGARGSLIERRKCAEIQELKLALLEATAALVNQPMQTAPELDAEPADVDPTGANVPDEDSRLTHPCQAPNATS